MKLYDVINQNFESSCSVTPQYAKAKATFKRTLNSIFGKENVVMNSCPHFEFTGFIKRNGKYVYFSTGDLRWRNSMLIRTAKNDEDYTGGQNNEINYNVDLDTNFINKVNSLTN